MGALATHQILSATFSLAEHGPIVALFGNEKTHSFPFDTPTLAHEKFLSFYLP